MVAVLLSRLALDAQDAVLGAARAVPRQYRDDAPARLNSAAWIVTHMAEAHQIFVGAYVGGRDRDAWYDDFRWGEWLAPAFDAAFISLERTLLETTEVLNALTEPDLLRPVKALPTSRFAGLAAGQMIARAIAHLYVHAADLNTLIVLGGGDDLGLPQWQEHVRMGP